MLSVDEALQQVLERVTPRAPAQVPLADALGLVLAEALHSDVDSPPHDKSLVDGYAVVAADLAAGPAELDILEEITAGNLPTHTVVRGNTTRIMTGAPVPAGADAIVMIEQSRLADERQPLGRVHLAPPRIASGQNIMLRASSMARGDLVLAQGCVLRAIELGLAAEIGHTHVSAIGRPTVAVLATGNELVPPSQTPAAGQIRNSNGSMLLAAAARTGATPVDLGIARDVRGELRDSIARGLESDVLVIAGGVSAGVLDLVPSVLQELGVAQVFHKIRLKPGKPLWFGVHKENSRLVFGLPGNPVSSLVCFELFVRPAIGRLCGREDLALEEVMAELSAEYTHRGDRPTYHPARLTPSAGIPSVEPLRWQGSGDLRTLAAANALAYFPAGDRTIARGEIVRVLRLPR